MRTPVMVSWVALPQELPRREHQESYSGPTRNSIGHDIDGVVGMAAWAASNGAERDTVGTDAGRFMEQCTPKSFVYWSLLLR